MRYVSSKTVGRALGAALLSGALGGCDFIEPVTTNPNGFPRPPSTSSLRASR